MRKILLFSLFLILFSCEGFDRKMKIKASYDLVVPNIKKAISGVVTEKYSYRTNHPPNYLIINEVDTIYASNQNFVRKVNLGDSIVKKQDDNIIRVYNKNKLVIETWHMLIPQYLREDSSFPEEWKNKWLEATFDPTNKNLNIDSILQIRRID